jgi:photosystem II stability/assembly factor-like uncharacterized protein
MKTSSKRACAVVAAGFIWAVGAACSAETIDVLAQPAVQSSVSAHGVLLDIARAGKRLVAVGERGIVLLSDDNGQSWRQAPVPVSTTLTAVRFADRGHGWAVGHSGVILHSADGGETWHAQLDGKRAAVLELEAAQAAIAAEDSEQNQRRLQDAQRLIEDGADKPFLAVHFSDAQQGIAVGAFGLAFQTTDGGQSWVSFMGRLPNSGGLHLYAIAQSGPSIYLAGEQGLLLRSQDNGAHFEALESPYEGSYFTLGLLPSGSLLVGGLRGNVFRSENGGSSFQPVVNPVPVSLSSVAADGQRTVFVNQAGVLLGVNAQGSALIPIVSPPGPPLTAATFAADNALVAVGFAGPQRISAQPIPE